VPKAFISAVFPIFCSFPLYQISGLHFYVNAVFDTIRFCLEPFDFGILFDFSSQGEGSNWKTAEKPSQPALGRHWVGTALPYFPSPVKNSTVSGL